MDAQVGRARHRELLGNHVRQTTIGLLCEAVTLVPLEVAGSTPVAHIMKKRFCTECGLKRPIEDFDGGPSRNVCKRDHANLGFHPLSKAARRKHRRELQKLKKVAHTAKKVQRVVSHHDNFPVRPAKMSKAEYAAYLTSPHWIEFKERYAASDKLQECFVCGTPKFELHHRTYDRVHQELLEDVVPLCDEHHRRVHRAVRAGKSLMDAHTWVKSLYQRGEREEVRVTKIDN